MNSKGTMIDKTRKRWVHSIYNILLLVIFGYVLMREVLQEAWTGG
jgi:hypothetical protein